MPKVTHYVLRAGKVVYRPGHYDLESARQIADSEATDHPESDTICVVEVVERIPQKRRAGR